MSLWDFYFVEFLEIYFFLGLLCLSKNFETVLTASKCVDTG
jgi:hypothetical protein